MYVWRPEVNVECLPLSLSGVSYRPGSSLCSSTCLASSARGHGCMPLYLARFYTSTRSLTSGLHASSMASTLPTAPSPQLSSKECVSDCIANKQWRFNACLFLWCWGLTVSPEQARLVLCYWATSSATQSNDNLNHTISPYFETYNGEIIKKHETNIQGYREDKICLPINTKFPIHAKLLPTCWTHTSEESHQQPCPCKAGESLPRLYNCSSFQLECPFANLCRTCFRHLSSSERLSYCTLQQGSHHPILSWEVVLHVNRGKKEGQQESMCHTEEGKEVMREAGRLMLSLRTQGQV